MADALPNINLSGQSLSGDSNWKVLIPILLWLAIVYSAIYYFFFVLFMPTPKESFMVNSLAGQARISLIVTLVLSTIAFIVILIASFSTKVARSLLFLESVGLGLSAVGYVLFVIVFPCHAEAMACASTLLIFPEALIFVVSLISLPILLFLLSEKNQKTVKLAAFPLFIVISLVFSGIYLYKVNTLPTQFKNNIANAPKTLGFDTFKPNYLPQKAISSQFEDIRTILPNCLEVEPQGKLSEGYDLLYLYGDKSRLEIQEIKIGNQFDLLQKYLTWTPIKINGNDGFISVDSAKNYRSETFTNACIVWKDQSTFIDLRYDSTPLSIDQLRAESIKIAESIERR